MSEQKSYYDTFFRMTRTVFGALRQRNWAADMARLLFCTFSMWLT